MRRRERFSLLNRIESVDRIPKIRVYCIVRKRCAPEPMARRFLKATLYADLRTQHLVSRARALYLFDVFNEKVIGEFDKLTEEFRNAALPVGYSQT